MFNLQRIPGISPIQCGYNPATWMLEISSQANEEHLSLDFANFYRNSSQFKEVESVIQELSKLTPGTEPLKFPSKFAQNILNQFKICYRKQNLVYWRSPQYNVVRLFFTTLAALIFGTVFWNVGSSRYYYLYFAF
jgi:ABC-2 type transporter